MSKPSSARPVRIALLVGLALLWCGAAQASDAALRRVLTLSDASLLVEVAGRPVIARQTDRPMIPASTMKLVTALAAIEHWGLEHRFTTDFYLTEDGWLWVAGAGDPYLVSEELERIASALVRARIGPLTGIGIDDGLYAQDLRIPGRAASDNPYDAPVTALAVNFNTLHVKAAGGRVTSGEPQTPLTPLARELGGRLGPGAHRINLKERELALRYAGELLAAKLEAAGVAVGERVRIAARPSGAKRVLTYRNSRDLRAVLAPMLEYSNNFIANQIFLMLAGDPGAAGLDMPRAQRALTRWAVERFGWRDFRIEDGAGLSRGNRLSARQLADVVEAFAGHRDLLPEQPGQRAVRAKTGTLTGVSAYAGSIRRDDGWANFVLLINQPVEADLRRRVAAELAELEDLGRVCRGDSC